MPVKRKENSKAVTLRMADGATIPRLMIVGRGQMHGRKLHAIRIKPQVAERLGKIVSGPLYLAVEIAITRLCDQLESHDTSTVEIVRAEDLG